MNEDWSKKIVNQTTFTQWKVIESTPFQPDKTKRSYGINQNTFSSSKMHSSYFLGVIFYDFVNSDNTYVAFLLLLGIFASLQC
jgi:hypothetical protein